MVRSQTKLLERMNETRPSLIARVFDSVRYRARLALVVFCAAAAIFYVAGHALNQGFESSVVVTYPLPSQDPLLPPPAGAGPALIAALDQNPALDDAFHQSDPQSPWIARLGARADRAFYRTHLTITALPTSLHNSIPLSINAKESTPENAQALARAIGQAVYHDAVSQQPVPPQPVPQAIAPTPAPLPVAPPPAPIIPPPAPQQVAAQSATRHYIKPPPLNSEAMEQRKSLTDELIAAEDRRVLLSNELNDLDKLERTQSVHPPPVRSFNEATLRTQISESRATLNDLEKRYTDRHPDVVAERDRLRDLETKLDQALAHDEAVVKQQAIDHANLPAVRNRVARQAEIRPELTRLNAQITHDTAEIDRLSAVVAAEADTRRHIEAENAAQNAAPAPAPTAPQPTATSDAAKQAAKDAADIAVEREQVRQLTQRVQAYLQSGAAPAGPSSQPPATIVPPPSSPSFPSPTTLVSEPTLITTALVLAFFAALLSIFLTEGTGRFINDGRGLAKELPTGVEFLGEIPKMSTGMSN